MIKLYNTLSRKKEIFKPIKDKKVGMYTCGPTVYDYDHLGHAWTYTQADLLRRMLEYNGYKIKQVLNITDVGHLTDDSDSGEDKMEKSAKEKKKNVFEIADYYIKIYLENRKKLNLEEPEIICRATDHIKEMIDLIKILIKKGYAYETEDGIYFEVKKFPFYGKLSGNTLKKLKAGARIEINPYKKSPFDFALWKLTPKGVKRQMEWDSPWGKGFPGWHIECSAMSMKYLGKTFDIHTGGEDNIFPHHESEIAQSEAATGKKFVNYWFHPRFLKINGQKMSKSLKNFLTLSDIEKEGFSAIDLRYLFLTSHYKSPFNFTFKKLKNAQISLNKIYENFSLLKEGKGEIDKKYKKEFLNAINDDLNMPKAISVLWKLIKDKKIKEENKRATLIDFDKVLGLNIEKIEKEIIPPLIEDLAYQREKLRKEKKWEEADKLRKEIEKNGYRIDDTKKGPIIKKIK
ncbi:MAG TPA: cysteine--tRNA ligase [Candidatus Pacearchaeota archaeon]|nr:cysteine--tRNA ligase [Candidatus Pacearchaeota archaeon]HPO68242.1 cysteine--tRNA ligase [Candidatus Pacearchaeota archaeon]